MATLNALSAIADACGGLGAVSGVLQLRGYVRAAEDYEDHAWVMDAASAVLRTAFPDTGHVRTAVGVSSLPGGAPVEVELLVELSD